MGLVRLTRKRKRPDGTTYEYTSPVWHMDFTDPLTGRRIQKSTGTRDRRAANAVYLNALQRAARGDKYELPLQKPIAAHIDDWQASLRAKGRCPGHIHTAVRRARVVFDKSKTRTWGEVSASAVLAAVEALAVEHDLGAWTFNFYVAAAKQFSRWMMREWRAPDDPLIHLGRRNPDVNVRQVRRALSNDEACALIATTKHEPTRFNMTGPARAVLYELAMSEG